MAGLQWASSVITEEIRDVLETAHVSGDLKVVYYGDQERIPRTPAAAVMSGPRTRDFNQTGIQYEIMFDTHILVYHGLIQDLATLTKTSEELVETLEATMHLTANRKLPDSGDPRIVHGYISSVEPGFAQRGKALFVVHRMTHTSRSRQVIS